MLARTRTTFWHAWFKDCDCIILELNSASAEVQVWLRKNLKQYLAWSCQNVCDVLTFLFDNIFIRFGTKLYRQLGGIPMSTNCAYLVADVFPVLL